MIRFNAIMGNVDICSSIKEAFKVESKNEGKLLFDKIFVSRMKNSKTITQNKWCELEGQCYQNCSIKSIEINGIWFKAWIQVWRRKNTKVDHSRILMERV